jgi:hypothetical protein
MGGPAPVPPAFPTVVPNPTNPNTAGFPIFAVQVVSTTQLIIWADNNFRVGDQILIAGLSTFTGLNNHSVTIAATAGSSLTAYNSTPNTINIANPGAFPAGLSGMIPETGLITRLTPAPTQPALFFTDPQNYEPYTDGSGPLIITRSVESVEHPGRQIPDLIIGSVVRVQRVTITSAQLLALGSTPIEILPEPHFVPSGIQGTPGRGLAYSIKFVHIRSNMNGLTVYSGSVGSINLWYGPVANNEWILDDEACAAAVTTLLTEPTDYITMTPGIAWIEPVPIGIIANQPIMLAAPEATLAGGTGMLTWIIEYTVVQV